MDTESEQLYQYYLNIPTGIPIDKIVENIIDNIVNHTANNERDNNIRLIAVRMI